MTPSVETFYEAFREMSRAVHAGTGVEEVLELAVWKITEILGAKGAIMRLLNLDSQELELSAAYGLSEAYLAKGPVTRQSIITDLYRQKRAIIIEDLANDPRIQYPQEAAREGLRMVLDLPLTFREHLAGILRVFFGDLRSFSSAEIDFAVSLSEMCSCAIEKARLIEAQQSRYDQLALQTEKLSALGRMAAGIAHEINNPLAGILLFSSNLAKKAPPGQMKEGLEIIMRETQRCKIIIQELLEFARDRQPKKVLASINRIIEKSLGILENEFHLRHVQLQKELVEGIQEALLDENQLEQVFVNLLLNALQAIGEKGTITVRSQTDARQKRLTVDIIDTGCGIAREHLDKIFDPFFSTKKDGSGLGLAVSYGIIQNHQGQIEVESQVGQTTRFRITIPLFSDRQKPKDRP